MGTNTSSRSKKKASIHLAFARQQLQDDYKVRWIGRRIPSPQPGSASDEDEANDFDSEAESIDRTDDVIMDDKEDAQLGVYNAIPAIISSQLSLEEQHAIRNFESVHTTVDDINLSEGAQCQRDSEELLKDDAQIQTEDQSTETHTYPEPEAPEMIPPQTPILSHAELPMPSIELDTPNKYSNYSDRTLDITVQDSEDGDLSDITPLLHTDELTLSPAGLNALSTSGPMPYAVMQDSEDEDLSNSTQLLHDKPWWQEFKEYLRERQSISQPTALSLTCVAIHRDGLIEFRENDLIEEPLPEQPLAKELTTPSISTGNVDQDVVDDAVLALIMEDMETMEAEAEAARAKRERRRTRCRAHSFLDSEHYRRFQICRRAHCFPLVSTREPRPYTRKEIQKIKAERFSMPPWKKHCVWQRCLLAKETKLTPFLDDRGLLKTCSIYHKGKGPTGGNIGSSRWKYCNQCQGNCNGR